MVSETKRFRIHREFGAKSPENCTVLVPRRDISPCKLVLYRYAVPIYCPAFQPHMNTLSNAWSKLVVLTTFALTSYDVATIRDQVVYADLGRPDAGDVLV